MAPRSKLKHNKKRPAAAKKKAGAAPAPKPAARKKKRPAATGPKAQTESPQADNARQEQHRAHHTSGDAFGDFTAQYQRLFGQMNASWVEMMRSPPPGATATDMLSGWMQAQRDWLHQAQGGLANPQGPFGFDMMQAWQRQMQAFDPLRAMADMPGLGYSRERHEDFARLYKAWQAHDMAQRRYMSEIIGIVLFALGRFEAEMAMPRAEGAGFTSLKQVYARWVDINEDAYARFAESAEHAKLYAQLVDTLSAVKKEMSLAADRMAAQWNMPTRAEIDNLHRAMHDLRRENRDLRKTVEAMGRKGGRR